VIRLVLGKESGFCLTEARKEHKCQCPCYPTIIAVQRLLTNNRLLFLALRPLRGQAATCRLVLQV